MHAPSSRMLVSNSASSVNRLIEYILFLFQINEVIHQLETIHCFLSDYANKISTNLKLTKSSNTTRF